MIRLNTTTVDGQAVTFFLAAVPGPVCRNTCLTRPRPTHYCFDCEDDVFVCRHEVEDAFDDVAHNTRRLTVADAVQHDDVHVVTMRDRILELVDDLRPYGILPVILPAAETAGA